MRAAAIARPVAIDPDRASEGRQRPRMPPCPCRNGDQAVRALFHRFAGEDIVDDIMQDDAAIAVNGVIYVFPRAK